MDVARQPQQALAVAHQFRVAPALEAVPRLLVFVPEV